MATPAGDSPQFNARGFPPAPAIFACGGAATSPAAGLFACRAPFAYGSATGTGPLDRSAHCPMLSVLSRTGTLGGGMPSFARDIRSLFRDSDISRMQFAFDLSQYDDVKANADGIYDRLSDGSMPCDGPWPADRVAL